ncbi:unnamed protein product [Rodentolepis nana]|uniref:Uncharacterized protein n=1 Tax=Rodentolepis nana TaxID=102285 RepID=A0A158QJ65_RODNA|nr:unnamed protein product [Rodentolepis nana]
MGLSVIFKTNWKHTTAYALAEIPAVLTQSAYHRTTTPASSQNGISIQNRTSIPVGASVETQTNSAITTSTVLQQPHQLPFQPQMQPQPTNSLNQPAFAVIAQDPSALQALLSGDLGGRTFIIQPLQQPYILPQFHVTPPQYPPFTITQPVLQPPVYPKQQEQSVADTKTQSPLAPIQEPLQNQSMQNSTIETPNELPLEIAPPTITLREATPQPIIEPLTIATDTRPLPQTAPCSRSPPRSVQSIFKQHSPQLQQTHEAHKIPLREPQRLSTPVFLQKTQKTQTPSPQSEQQAAFTPAKATTPKLPPSNPLCEYAEKLKLAPNRAGNRRTIVGGTKKSKNSIISISNFLSDSPMESFKEEDLEIGSCLSSPAASVLSDFSEIVCAQNPSKYRGLRIY